VDRNDRAIVLLDLLLALRQISNERYVEVPFDAHPDASLT